MNIFIILVFLLNIGNSFIFKSTFLTRASNSVVNNDFDYNYSCWNGRPFNTLIFKGGGSRAIAYIGAMKRLEKDNFINNITNIAGTSSGAQTAALICCGYISEDIHIIVTKFPWKKVLDTGFFNLKGIFNIFYNYGFYNSKNLNIHLENLIYNKTKVSNITFLELYKLSNIHLKVGVCSLTERKFKYLDYIDYPDMPVSIGITASSSIPFVFTYTKWKNETFVDGGLVGNLPLSAFPNETCLAFNLIGYNELENKLNKNPNNLIEFIRISFALLYKYAQEMISPKNKNLENIDFIEIYADKIKLLDSKINSQTINKVIECGYNSVDKFLNCF